MSLESCQFESSLPMEASLLAGVYALITVLPVLPLMVKVISSYCVTPMAGYCEEREAVFMVPPVISICVWATRLNKEICVELKLKSILTMS